MIDVSDRHFRYLCRLLSRHTLLYTEMVTTPAILHGKRERLLGFSREEDPVAVQLGGNDPAQLAECSQLAREYGYCEVNLNCGCPSDRVQDGAFGACLMKTPERVREGLIAMAVHPDMPVTLKCRTGIGRQDDFDTFLRFIDITTDSPCQTVIVHARNAWLEGLSPKENREIPPLKYEWVYRLKTLRPHLTIVINGGIKTLDEMQHHLLHVDGVMIGREVWHNTYVLADIDAAVFGDNSPRPDRLCGKVDGPLSAAADHVDGHGRNAHRKPGPDGRLTCRVLARTSGKHLSNDDVVYVRRIDAGIREHRLDHLRADLDRRELGKRATQAADGGPARGGDVDARHGPATSACD